MNSGIAIGRAFELDLVAHDVEHAAALEAGRLVLVDEVNRHVDVHLRVLAEMRRKSTWVMKSRTGSVW